MALKAFHLIRKMSTMFFGDYEKIFGIYARFVVVFLHVFLFRCA